MTDPASLLLPRLEEALRGSGSVLVAMSGGVDSAVVAAAAHRVLGPRALAVTLRGPAVPREEVERAAAVARAIGVAHRFVELDPTNDDRYASNPTNRCYFCRSQEGSALVDLARREGFVAVVDGIHRDDLGDDRPGVRAMDERGVRHPLLEAGLGKSDVRAIAKELGLPNWDTPSNSCLASRVAHGELIRPELLARIDEAETYLRAQGFRQVRVRTSHGSARIEVGAEETPRFRDPTLTSAVLAHLLSLGFSEVIVDPRGYRPGGGRIPPPPSALGPAPGGS